MIFKKYIRESIDDMDKRCEFCNTLLNDGGTCPVCDDGEEDYTEALVEKKSARELLKAAFPELNFDREVKEEVEVSEDETEEVLTEDVAEDAFKTVLASLATEDGSKWLETVTKMFATMNDSSVEAVADKAKAQFGNVRVSTEDKKNFMNAAEDSVAPDDVENSDTVEDLFNVVDNSESAKSDAELKKKLVIAILTVVAVIEPTPFVELLVGVAHALPADIVANIMDSVTSKLTEEMSIRDKLKALYPELNFNKVVEDVEVGEEEVLTEEAVDAKLTFSNKDEQKEFFELCKEIGIKTAADLKRFVDENITDGTQVLDALRKYREELGKDFEIQNESCNDTMEEKAVEVVSESEDIAEDDWYDDDYSFDDVEEDRRHVALYGGDRMYCKCGQKLVRTEWGGYCPDCEPEVKEEEQRSMYDDYVD